MVIEISSFDFKYFVILIFILKVRDMAASVQVTIGFHTNFGGLSVLY